MKARTNRHAGVRKELLRWRMDEKDIPFPPREFRERLARLKSAMGGRGLDMVFLSSPESMYYFSGYKNEWYQAQSCAEWPPASGIAVHRYRSGFILFDTEDEYLLARHTSVADDIRVFPTDERPDGEMPGWIVEELKGENWLPARVGLEMRSYRPNRVVSELFQKELQREGCQVTDCTSLVRGLRRVKSSLELRCVERAAEIAIIGMRACQESIRPGATELEVWGDVMRAMAHAGGENQAITMPVSSGPRAPLIHALATRRKIEKGDLVVTDICGVYNRYHVNCVRTFSVGRARPAVERGVRLAGKAFDILERLIEPNLPVERLLSEMKDYYSRAGIERRRWWWGGYELGIAFPPDWVGEFVYDPTIDPAGARFEPGMVVNYESNFYLPENAGLAALVDTLVFGRDSARIMCKEIPFELLIV